MAPVNQVAFYKAFVKLGTMNIPMLEGPTLSIDENFITPQPLGNYWMYNFANGLIQPTVDCNLLVRDNASECLSLAFLNQFLTRSNDNLHDTSILGANIVFYDGADAQQLVNPKAESFTINCSKGEIVGMSCRFVGTDVTSTSAPSIPTWDNSPPLVYTAVNFDVGSLKDVAYQFGISFSNNSYPDMALNGGRGPAKWNAGVQSAGFNFRVQANATVPADGTSYSLILTGANVTRTFTLNSVLIPTRRARSIARPQVMRNHRGTCLGANGSVTGPLSIS